MHIFQCVYYFIPSSIGAPVRQPKRKAAIHMHFFKPYLGKAAIRSYFLICLLFHSIINQRVSAPTQEEGYNEWTLLQDIPYWIPSSIGASAHQPKRKAASHAYFPNAFLISFHRQSAHQRANPRGRLQSMYISSGYTLLNSIFKRRVTASTQKEACIPSIFLQRFASA